MAPSHPNDEIAVLLGNGLSVAYNTDLAMGPLTKAIVERFNAEAGGNTDAAHILAGLAADVDEDDAVQDFEALLGPLDQIGDSLAQFEGLAALTSAKLKAGDVSTALGTITGFLKEVQRLGVGHALEVIDDAAYADQEQLKVVRDFVEAIMKASRTAKVTIGNLSYDSLVMSALLALGADLCDMAKGYGQGSHDIGGSDSVIGFPLRTASDFINSHVRLLHLHGSVSWLRKPGGLGRIYRFRMADIRMNNFWENYREGKTDWSPVVVLTNQRAKSTVVSRWPFSLAYVAFYERLLEADRWLLAGYSFRDECVDDVLRQAFAARTEVPHVLVVGRGKYPTWGRVLTALGYDPDRDPDPDTWLTISRDGISGSTQSAEWAEWSDE